MQRRERFRNRRGLALALVVPALALAACAGLPNVPPVSTASAETPRYGKFVWYDLLTEDLAAVKEFYGGLLGWTFAPTEAPNYTLILHEERPIGGIVDMAAIDPTRNRSQWISLLSTEDVDAAVRITREAGGEIHVRPLDLPGRGRFAVVSDPQGAAVAFLRSSVGDPPDAQARPGEWLWTELWTDDLQASSGFYRDLVGYSVREEVLVDDRTYAVFTRGEVPRAGMIRNPLEKVRAHWLPYVRTEDPAALAEQVEALGGTVVLAPRDDVRRGSVAIVLDPSGAALALQRWPVS